MAYLSKEPEDYARLLLSQLGLERVYDLEDLLRPLRLKLESVEGTTFEGALVCRKNRSKGIIAVRSDIPEEGRKRFTVCHEIGHFILPGHGEFSCKPGSIESWKLGLSTQEQEANRVASELLLPSKAVYPMVCKKKATLSLAKDLSSDFGSSLTAAALKIVELSEEACAVIWSINESIKWFKKNDTFWRRITLGKLDEQSVAAKLFRDNEVREYQALVFAETWVEGDDLSSKIKIWEDSIHLPNYDAVLTILTLDA